MFICSNDDCGKLWGAWLTACPADGSPLREFGEQPSDFEQPAVSRFPLAKARAQQRLGRAVASGGAGGGLGSPPVRPAARGTVAEWRSYAVGIGVPMAAVEQAATKAELADLAAAAEAGTDQAPASEVA